MPAIKNPTMTLDQILDCLERKRVRATYGAVGAVIGRPAQSVGAALGNRRKRASWVVNARTGEPTGYDPTEKHPDLYFTSHIIKAGEELRRLCAESHEADPILAIGVDGCSTGWFFVEIEPAGTFRCGVVQTLHQLVRQNDRIMPAYS